MDNETFFVIVGNNNDSRVEGRIPDLATAIARAEYWANETPGVKYHVLEVIGTCEKLEPPAPKQLTRRDLKPGDVFVYASLPEIFNDDPQAGVIRYVKGAPSWFDGAAISPEQCDAFGPFDDDDLSDEVLDSPVIVLQRPAGRLEKRQQIRDDIGAAIEVLDQLRDSI